MRLNTLRWLLAPRTSILAARLRRTHGHQLSRDAAWRLARVRLHPDEIPYRNSGHVPPM